MTLSEDITQLLNITIIYKHINWCQKITMNRSTIVAERKPENM